MELYQQQQFDFLIQTATERLVVRLEERFRGSQPALDRLRADPNGEGVWIEQFTEAVFEDFLLNNVEGASFVLRALHRRLWPVETNGETVEEVLLAAARRLFSELLARKTVESLEQRSAYQAVGPGG